MSASVTSVSTSTIATIQLETELSGAKAELLKRDKQIEDLQEKLDTIMAKRSEDREKIREFEKTKIQLEQLLEYKARITESQADLQKQLAQVTSASVNHRVCTINNAFDSVPSHHLLIPMQAKKDAQDAIDEKNRHAEEMSDVNEAIEMATLDKEMAEEKVSHRSSSMAAYVKHGASVLLIE